MTEHSAHIVDDDPLMTDLLTSFLFKFGYRNIIKSTSFQQAVRDNHTAVCDLVFVDIELGDGNGLNLINEIKERYPLSKIVMFSGYGTKDNVKTALEMGADGFLLKPFSMQNLGQTLKRVDRYHQAPALV